MNLLGLEPREQLVFGGLVRLLIRSDGSFTAAEEAQVERLLGDGLPPERIWHLISASAQEWPDEQRVREHVAEVTRPEARALILETLGRVAGADGVADPERDLLEWLRRRWAADRAE